MDINLIGDMRSQESGRTARSTAFMCFIDWFIFPFVSLFSFHFLPPFLATPLFTAP